MLERLKNPWIWIPTAAVVTVGVVTGVIGFFTRNWLLAVIAALSLLLIVLVVLMVRMLVHREREERLDLGLEDEADLEKARAGAASDAAGADLKDRFRFALGEIRTKLGGRGGVYELPWYLVIGGLGSGKSALLNESGLDLPAQYARSRVFGPTRSCEFLLFNEAIALDTAGRYFSSEADEDRAEWQNLLGYLRSSRPECPINGVIFTIPAPSLLTLSPEQLEEEARQLRRRLNEIQVGLGVDAPIYLVVTQADLIEGFSEFASGVPPERHAEAFGWTNDQRRLADAEQRIAEAFEQIRARLDGMLHELLLRDPDPVRKRQAFVFPQELEVTGRAVARFAASAFKRDIYNAMPFLRGVYFTSARTAGDAVSPTLYRLGQDWARTQHGAGAPGARYLRELFLQVIIGDEELAAPDSRIGPASRRVIMGAGGLVALGVLTLWGVSFVQGYRGSHDLARHAALALSTDPTIHHLSDLRESIEQHEAESKTYVNRLGFGTLGRAVADAKRTFVAAFAGNFDRLARQNLDRSLRQRDDTAFRAAVTAATDLVYLADGAEGDSSPPDLTPYMPHRVKDYEGYHQAYRRFVQWMRAPDRQELLERQRDTLATRAGDMIKLGPLEAQTEKSGGRFSSVRYTDVGLDARGMVPGIYTRAGLDGLFGHLLGSVERTGAVPPARVNELRRRYVDRYERSWRRYLLGVPTEPRSDPSVRKSPHLEILQQVHENTSVELARDGSPPDWIGMVAEIHRTEPAGEEEKSAPYPDYRAALENVAIDVEDAVGDPEQALLIARDAGEGKPTSFGDALAVARRIVPRGGDASVRSKLREILEAPILDGFSAVLDAARRELSRRWNERIASQFGEGLSEQELTALYDPSAGELKAFLEEELDLFYGDGVVKRVLEDRKMSFGPGFLSWMERAGAIQRSLFAGRGGVPRVSVQLRGVPASVSGAPGLRVKRRDLRLSCPDGEQTFVYREGTGTETFNWTASCQSLTLRIVLGGADRRDREFRREWTGPLALPKFLQQAKSVGGGVLQWSIDGPEGITVQAKYRLVSGEEIRGVVHQSPPPSLGS